MKINELFKSIEGEGVFQGYLTLFIRLAQCNLECSWCDTKYAFKNFMKLDMDFILKFVKDSNIKYITITGGEPFLQQKELLQLVTEIKKLKKEICIYTNGTIEIDTYFFNNTHVILDYKMDYKDLINKTNLLNLKNGVIKFVIKDVNEFKHITNSLFFDSSNISISLRDIYNNNNKIHITPAFKIIQNKEIANYLMNNNLYFIKLSLQQHKYIWNPDERGV